MLRDLPQVIVIMITSIFTIVFLGRYFSTSMAQDSIILDMNESVRTMAISNTNLRSRTTEAELFIDKPDFEEAVIERLHSGTSSLDKDDEYVFEYLDNDSGSVKAIRLIVNTDDGKTYQSTVKVDVADQ